MTEDRLARYMFRSSNMDHDRGSFGQIYVQKFKYGLLYCWFNNRKSLWEHISCFLGTIWSEIFSMGKYGLDDVTYEIVNENV